ncbi:hypothetical protein EGU64_14995, partial [Achromobacter denitrificans]
MEDVKQTVVPAGPIASPSLVVYPRPFESGDRIDCYAAFLPGETLGAFMRRTRIAAPSRVLRVEHNGCPVPLALWDRLIPRQGDMVVVSARALGGGGGGKVLRTVAMLAVVAAAFYAPAFAGLTKMVGGIEVATLGGSALSAGIMLGGSLLVGALLPLPTPTAAKLGTGQKYESSPTYAIQGGRNRARPWEPMLIIFGRHKVVPDAGAKPYSQYVGDTQFLNQIFHFGLQLNGITLSDLKIGETPVSNYQGVQLQSSDPNTGALSMFSGNVDTLQGFTLQSGVINTRTTPSDVTHISVEIASQLFYV